MWEDNPYRQLELLKSLPWVVLMVGLSVLAVWAMHEFPLVDGNDPLLAAVAAASFVLIFLALARKRHTLMPWGRQIPSIMWGGLLAFAAVGMFGVLAAFFTLNAVLDRSPARQQIHSVSGKGGDYIDRQLRVRPRSASDPLREVTVSNALFERADRGDTVRVTLRSGFFGSTWVEAVELLGEGGR